MLPPEPSTALMFPRNGLNGDFVRTRGLFDAFNDAVVCSHEMAWHQP